MQETGGSIPGSRRSPGEGHGNPLQYSCMEKSMDRGAWWATVYGAAKSQTQRMWLSWRPILVCLGYHHKIPQVGGLNNTDLLLTVLEAGSPSSVCLQDWLLVKPLFPVHGWLTSSCVFRKPFLCMHTNLLSLPLLTTTLPLSDDTSPLWPHFTLFAS